jgi:hypothetical protein
MSNEPRQAQRRWREEETRANQGLAEGGVGSGVSGGRGTLSHPLGACIALLVKHRTYVPRAVQPTGAWPHVLCLPHSGSVSTNAYHAHPLKVRCGDAGAGPTRALHGRHEVLLSSSLRRNKNRPRAHSISSSVGTTVTSHTSWRCTYLSKGGGEKTSSPCSSNCQKCTGGWELGNRLQQN